MTFRIGDSTADFKPPRLVRATIFDPPYNIGFNYGNAHNDSMKLDEYESYIQGTVENIYDNTEIDGSLFFIHNAVEAARLLPVIEGAGWRIHQWISWVYPSNTGHSQKRFTSASRVILWFSKTEEPYFNRLGVTQPFKNPNDRRVKERIAAGHTGVALYDWWEINMVKKGSKEHLGYYNQIPQELLKRIILCCTEEGDMVADAAAGSGSTYMATKATGRECYLIDKNPECLERWKSL